MNSEQIAPPLAAVFTGEITKIEKDETQ